MYSLESLRDESNRLLRQAAEEIKQLRQANEILRAKVEVMDLFALVLMTKPALRSHAAGEDSVWRIKQHLYEVEAEMDRSSGDAAPGPVYGASPAMSAMAEVEELARTAARAAAGAANGRALAEDE